MSQKNPDRVRNTGNKGGRGDRKTIYVPEDVADWLEKNPSINLSKLCREPLRHAMLGGDSYTEALQRRIDSLEKKNRDLKETLQRIAHISLDAISPPAQNMGPNPIHPISKPVLIIAPTPDQASVQEPTIEQAQVPNLTEPEPEPEPEPLAPTTATERFLESLGVAMTLPEPPKDPPKEPPITSTPKPQTLPSRVKANPSVTVPSITKTVKEQLLCNDCGDPADVRCSNNACKAPLCWSCWAGGIDNDGDPAKKCRRCRSLK
jgi:hypothetical protein